LRASASEQKTIIAQSFDRFTETFSVVGIDNIGLCAYSSHLSLLRQPPHKEV